MINYLPVSDSWVKISIPNIQITNSSCEVEFYSNADANEWCSIDDIYLEKTNNYNISTATYSPLENLITNSDFENNGVPSLLGGRHGMEIMETVITLVS